MNNDAPTLDHPDNDPWLWLEDIEGPRATKWADTQTAATLERFGGERLAADSETLRVLLDRPDNLPIPARRGGLLYNFWRDAGNPRGIWRRTTLDSFWTSAPDWELLLDIDALAAAEDEDWIWQGAMTLPPAHDLAMLRLSRGGSDAVSLREFDVARRCFVPGGFVLSEAKGAVDWLDADTLLLSSAFGGATQSGYASTVRLRARGSDPASAPILFEVQPSSMGASGIHDRADNRVVFVEQIGFFDTATWFGDRGGPKQRMDWPDDATVCWHDGWLALKPRTPWTVGKATYAADTALVIRMAAFVDGGRDFRVLFEAQPRRALQGMFWAGGLLVLSILDELRPVFLAFSPGDWTERTVAGLPDGGTAQVWPLDQFEEESDGTMLASVQDPLTPPTLMLIPPGLAAPVLLKRTPAGFDADKLVVSRHEAVSVDGERIPYTQTGPAGLTGEAPVHLSGYGGFAISRLPGYSLATGKLWLERGGTTVIANIRGGGEFGTRWHEAGRRAGKRLSHDDFAAVASDLVRRGVTRPGRIAAEGGSNGGLLIANMLTRYPERFGALFCTIPLIDMRRYTRLLAGASWIAEYGNPDDPDDWAFLGPISAYHAATPGQTYPPILLATARRDDRVHPGHARKMAAKLQAMGYDASFYEPAAGGHGYGKDNAEVAGFVALGMIFLRRSIGWQV
ncbi:prolyl oligopeptidase family serine peptidase [Lichenicoccus sp.]|uniref:prolyl oligopeptidase family serine peptidase n=1 Tax=Lichenicoccus sp. TaxID=2781899 RepID=UPI003D14865B